MADFQMLDVNHWRGEIRWDEVEPGRAFQIKVSDGETFTDPQFLNNWNGATERGFPKGGFHFMRTSASPSSARVQAERFWQRLEATGDPGELDLALDFEDPWSIIAPLGINQTRDFILNFVYKLHGLSGRYAMIYTNAGTWDKWVANKATGISDIPKICKLWVANWYVIKPQLPFDWAERYDPDWRKNDQVIWWQKGTIKASGINGRVDFCVFDGDLKAFNEYHDLEYGEEQPKPPPKPKPPPTVDEVEIVGLDGSERLNMRSAIWGEVVSQTWNGSKFKVEAVGQDDQKRYWYKLGESIWIAAWYAKPVK